MAEFKIGDKVVRKENFQHGAWERGCALSDKAATEVFTITDCDAGCVWLEGHTAFWDAFCFRLATGLEENQGVGLSAEDRLRESDAHIECLRELLDIERRQVGNLLALNNVLVDQAAHLQAKIAGLQAEVARCCGTVADKEVMQRSLDELNLVLGAVSTERDVLKRAIAHRVDERDAAVAAAKSLGEDLRVAREEVRWARFAKSHIAGLCDALFTATADIDLSHVAGQLRLLAQMCEDNGNGADAALAYNAAQVVELTSSTLSALDEVQEHVPSHFPPMDGPLA